jgi:hypothetical protein
VRTPICVAHQPTAIVVTHHSRQSVSPTSRKSVSPTSRQSMPSTSHIKYKSVEYYTCDRDTRLTLCEQLLDTMKQNDGMMEYTVKTFHIASSWPRISGISCLFYFVFLVAISETTLEKVERLKYPAINASMPQLLTDMCPNVFPIDTDVKMTDFCRVLTEEPEMVKKLVSSRLFFL